jgi:hypothetical protein
MRLIQGGGEEKIHRGVYSMHAVHEVDSARPDERVLLTIDFD